ncbi:PREDICTED: sphingomyelinase C 2-like [Priapulus caudatus]|uniref:sphingomyelin phosphodiesterase n=1 Tax=Priapulus caudatus TaxID=37621 RepID=A0ABM1F368_PRICU|nr:PREDICTED: sphingomyelinase C 2-like [Priapulus caudatus]
MAHVLGKRATTVPQRQRATARTTLVNGRDFPACTTKPEHCELFGLTYERSAPDGGDDGDEPCSSGDKVLCSSLAPTTAQVDTPAHTLNVLTYNIQERFWFISHDGQRERSCRIPAVLRRAFPDVDVIGFQEVFMGGCFPFRLSLRDLLAQHGFPYTTRTVGAIWPPPSLADADPDASKVEPNVDSNVDHKPSFSSSSLTHDHDASKVDSKASKVDRKVGLQITNGGIFIASRWPIVREAQHVYENADALSWDAFAKKGVAYAAVNKTDASGATKLYHVFSTHQQTGVVWETKVGQARELREMARRLGVPSDEPVVYVGDYNVDLYTEPTLLADVLSAMSAQLPAVVGPRACTVSSENDFYPEPKCDWVDYTTYSRDHQRPLHATMESVRPLADEPFPVCYDRGKIFRLGYMWPDDDRCRNRNVPLTDLADHFPLLGRFVFPK